MTKKLLTGTLSLNTTNDITTHFVRSIKECLVQMENVLTSGVMASTGWMDRGWGYRHEGDRVGVEGWGVGVEAVEGAGSGGKGDGGWGKRDGDNINYLVKIITENKFFHFLLRNWLFLSASDVYQIPVLTSISVVLAISLCLSLIPHIKSEVGRYVSEESNYNN